MTEQYDQNLFGNRVKIAELRSKVMTQVISIAILINAVPLSIKAIFDIPEVANDLRYWAFLASGWVSACLSLTCGLLFLALVPRWTRLKCKVANFLMDWFYPAAILFLGLATISFAVAVAYAIVGAFPLAGS